MPSADVIQMVPVAMKSVDNWRNLCASLLYFAVYVYDAVVKKFTFAISSADELLVLFVAVVSYITIKLELMVKLKYLYCMRQVFMETADTMVQRATTVPKETRVKAALQVTDVY